MEDLDCTLDEAIESAEIDGFFEDEGQIGILVDPQVLEKVDR